MIMEPYVFMIEELTVYGMTPSRLSSLRNLLAGTTENAEPESIRNCRFAQGGKTCFVLKVIDAFYNYRPEEIY